MAAASACTRGTRPSRARLLTRHLPPAGCALQVNPRTYIGSGKVQEIMAAVSNTGATTVIFDDELSPGGGRQAADAVWQTAVPPVCSTVGLSSQGD